MNYRHQIKGRYFLVLVLFLNIMALLPIVFLIKNPTPHERVVMAGIWAYIALNTAGMCWCLWDVLPEPLSTYNRFQNSLALVAGNLAATWIIVIWRYTGREHAEAVLMNSIPLVLVPVCALLVLALAVWNVGRVWKLATK